MPSALPGAPALGDALRVRLGETLARQGADYVPRTRHRRADGLPTYTNRLLLESSPYLRQHAHNPVNWYPWGDEAFAQAKRLGRPVLVSIGYSTCHWCHVMEEESFDDVATARLINERFIAIKVDREVRPDIDAVYMAAVQRLAGRGGWPLNVWLTPDREPFYGGTYFPPRGSPGRPGFRDVLRQLSDLWNADPERVEQAAQSLTAAVRAKLEGESADSTIEPRVAPLRRVLAVYGARFDEEWGGLGGGQKFPSSMSVPLLLRIHRRTGNDRALQMAVTTLERMATGGIHDHVGGGFHRYATERTWLVPHFEKMLYDNARLVVAYLDGWQATGREDFAAVARKTLDYVAREMKSPEGAFFSATDADSRAPGGHMHEGWFFTWTPGEIREVLGDDRGEGILDYYGVSEAGNFEGRSILHVREPLASVAKRLGTSEEDLRLQFDLDLARLYEARAERPPPLLDDKVLAAWNGLMISAFAQAGLALGEPDYTATAATAAGFALERMRQDGRLRRVFKDGRADGDAFLDDYAFLIAGLLDLHEADGRRRWLEEAIALQKVQDAHYLDAAGGGYFTTADDQEKLLAREKPDFDGAVPAGGSVAFLNLLRLHEITTEPAYLERAVQTLSAFRTVIESRPTELAVMLEGVEYLLDTPKQVILVAPASGPGPAELLDRLRTTYLPNRMLLSVREGSQLRENAELVPLVREKAARGGRPTAYVCERRICDLPTSDPDVFSKQIGRVAPLQF
ncbi:MAG: thioredoxin domain-containing protein [Deltaproteobacteria bacterium]|nr:thioredoxin domain-containing protein [Deltaproteobacteria bacterium]MBW2413862.1 thioredoxin domain-containing protein [Deltaproteobacteria bacterium]